MICLARPIDKILCDQLAQDGDLTNYLKLKIPYLDRSFGININCREYPRNLLFKSV